MTSARLLISASIIPVALVTQVAVSMVQQGLPSISIPIHRDLHLSLAGLGLVLGAANGATAASVYTWGRWSDRVGDRRVLLAGLSVAVPGLVAAGIAASRGYRARTMAGLLVAGVGVGAGTAALARALADRIPGQRWGLALGLRQAAVPVGGLVAAALLPAASEMVGVGAAFDVLGLACAIAGLGVAGFRPRSKPGCCWRHACPRAAGTGWRSPSAPGWPCEAAAGTASDASTACRTQCCSRPWG